MLNLKQLLAFFTTVVLFIAPHYLSAQMKFNFDQFMGINLIREDPLEKAACVGFAREYHYWNIDQGKAVQNSKVWLDTKFTTQFVQGQTVYQLYNDNAHTIPFGSVNISSSVLTFTSLNGRVYDILPPDPFLPAIYQDGQGQWRARFTYCNIKEFELYTNGLQQPPPGILPENWDFTYDVWSDAAQQNFVGTVKSWPNVGGGVYTYSQANVVYPMLFYDVHAQPGSSPTIWRISVKYAVGEMCYNKDVNENPIDDDGDGFANCDDTDDCDCTHDSPDYPNQLFRWNPPYQGQTEVHFDYFYNKLKGLGLKVSPSMTGSLPQLALGEEFQDTRIPVQFTGNPGEPNPIDASVLESPLSYRDRADWIYHYLARYGKTSPITACQAKYDPQETDVTHLGLVDYLESWNEPDKNWKGAASQFSPQAYAAMANCDYDGDKGTNLVTDPKIMGQLTDCNNTTSTYQLGVKHFGVPFVMGAPYKANMTVWNTWVLPMKQWFIDHRADDAFIFDVLNFHQYCFFGEIGGSTNLAHWVSPEEFKLRKDLKDMVAARDAEGWSGKEMWLSEFGYSSGGNDISIPSFASAELIQAQWNVRSFLEIAAAGFDRAMVHDLSDKGPISSAGPWDMQTGLVTAGGDPKLSWFFVYSLKNILNGKKYTGQIIPAGCVGDESSVNSSCPRIYKFGTGCGTIYAIWSPSSQGTSVSYPYTFTFPTNTCGNAATQISLVNGSITGLEKSLTVTNNNTVTVNVSETPIFIVQRPAHAPVIANNDCSNFIAEESKTCNSVTVSIHSASQPFTGYQIWYIKQGDILNSSYNINVDNPGFSPFLQSAPGQPIWHQFQTNVPPNTPNVVVSGLDPSTWYYIYVVPQSSNGLPSNGSGGALYCHLAVQTNEASSTGSCVLNITSNMILHDDDYNINPDDEGRLFDDQQASGFSDCALPDLSGGNNIPFFDYQNTQDPTHLNRRMMVLDLGKNYLIDEFKLYDGNSSGIFTIDGSLTDGNFNKLLDYYTDDAGWIPVANFVQPIDGSRYLRFTNQDMGAQVKEVLICAKEACLLNSNTSTPSHCINYDPNPVAWRIGCSDIIFKVKNQPQSPPYTKIQVWYNHDGSFDPNIHPATGTYPHGLQTVVTSFYTIPYNTNSKFFKVSSLLGSTKYWFAYRMLDDQGRSSKLYILPNTYTTGPCPPHNKIGPIIKDDCTIEGLYYEVEDNTQTGYFQVVERQTQSSAPLTGAIKTTNIPVVSGTTDYQYLIDPNYAASINTNWLYFRDVLGGEATDWMKWDIHDTSACGSVDGRSSQGSGQGNTSLTDDVLIYPNPAQNELNVVFNVENAYRSLTVLSLVGQSVMAQDIPANTEKLRLDTASLLPGVYQLRLRGDSNQVMAFKFVIMR